PGHGSLWGDPDCPGPPSGGARRRLPRAPGPLRSAAAKTTATTIGGLDQQAGATRPKDKGRKSVNSYAGCLKVLDTRRNPALSYEIVGFIDDDRAKVGNFIHR